MEIRLSLLLLLGLFLSSMVKSTSSETSTFTVLQRETQSLTREPKIDSPAAAGAAVTPSGTVETMFSTKKDSMGETTADLKRLSSSEETTVSARLPPGADTASNWLLKTTAAATTRLFHNVTDSAELVERKRSVSTIADRNASAEADLTALSTSPVHTKGTLVFVSTRGLDTSSSTLAAGVKDATSSKSDINTFSTITSAGPVHHFSETKASTELSTTNISRPSTSTTPQANSTTAATATTATSTTSTATATISNTATATDSASTTSSTATATTVTTAINIATATATSTGTATTTARATATSTAPTAIATTSTTPAATDSASTFNTSSTTTASTVTTATNTIAANSTSSATARATSTTAATTTTAAISPTPQSSTNPPNATAVTFRQDCQSPPSVAPQTCSTRDVANKCLIAIAALGALATVFMVSTIVLCVKLSARRAGPRRSQQATEMMCISSLLPERTPAYTRHRNPITNGVLVFPTGGDSDEDKGDNLTLSSFLPESA